MKKDGEAAADHIHGVPVVQKERVRTLACVRIYLFLSTKASFSSKSPIFISYFVNSASFSSIITMTRQEIDLKCQIVVENK